MDNNIGVGLIKDIQKIQYLFIVLPLITFIYYQVHLGILVSYTIFVAILSLYVHLFLRFTGIVRAEVLCQKKNKNKLNKVPYPLLFLLASLINIVGFIYSFYLSYIHFSYVNRYGLSLLLIHIFVFTIQIFILFIVGYYKKVVRKNAKKKIQAN